MKYTKIVFLSFLITTIFYAQDGVKTPSFAHKTNEQKLNKNSQVLNDFRRLDSVITTSSAAGNRNPQYKHAFTYNSNGSLATWLTQTVYGHQQNVQLLTYEYNRNNKITSILYEKWDTDQWVYVSRNSYTYDSLTTKLTEQWDGNKWINHTREIKGQSSRTIGENWDMVLSEWVKSWRNTELVEHLGDPPVSTLEYWTQNEWVKGYRTTYTYDYKDNIVPDIIERGGGDEWNTYMAYEYSIRDDDTTSALSYQWDWNSSQYKRYKRQTCVYLDFNYVQNYISSCFNETYNNFNSSWEDGFADIKFTDSYGNNFSFQTYRADFYYSITTTDVADEGNNISNFSLSQNYPNPFNPSTTIHYSIPNESEVSISVYNILGAKVEELFRGRSPAGNYEVNWNASNFSSGIYFLRMNAVSIKSNGHFADVKKLILLK